MNLYKTKTKQTKTHKHKQKCMIQSKHIILEKKSVLVLEIKFYKQEQEKINNESLYIITKPSLVTGIKVLETR